MSVVKFGMFSERTKRLESDVGTGTAKHIPESVSLHFAANATPRKRNYAYLICESNLV